MALLTTVAAYVFSSNQSTLRAQDHFDREVAHVTNLIQERMATYEDALQAGVAAINVLGGQIDHADWRTFERSLELGTRYPGVNGIGIIFRVPEAELATFLEHQQRSRPEFRVHPPVPADVHFPITFIEPESDNRAAIGLDVAFESSRLEAILAAAETGSTQMTAPIILVQDDRSSPGFLIYTPIFEHNVAPFETRPNFAGAVYAPFIMERLIAGTLGRNFRSVLIEIRDGDAMLYTEEYAGQATADPNPMFSTAATVEMFGRTWTVSLETTAGFRELNGTAAPSLVLAFGLIVEATLLMLFVGLGRANGRAVHLAQSLTEALQIEKRELEASNLALERYNYLSSHDLRTPLRGMHDVADDIRDGLVALYPDAAVNPIVGSHLEDLNALIAEMDALIGGMVAYSQMGRAKENRMIFSTEDELLSLTAEQSGSRATIALTGDMPEIFCNRDLFRIIAMHLIVNAVTHHPLPGEAQIAVECRAIGRNLILQVEDDGKGIAPHLQGQLFDRLTNTDDGPSSHRPQMGLAMVKRAASAIGGYVTFTSQVGLGSCFTVILLDVYGPAAKAVSPGKFDPRVTPIWGNFRAKDDRKPKRSVA